MKKICRRFTYIGVFFSIVVLYLFKDLSASSTTANNNNPGLVNGNIHVENSQNNKEAFHLPFSSVLTLHCCLAIVERKLIKHTCYPHWPWEGVIVRDIHYAPSLTLCVRSLDESVLCSHLFIKWGRSWPTVWAGGSYGDFQNQGYTFSGRREGGNIVRLKNSVLPWCRGRTCWDVFIAGIHRLWILESLIRMLEWLVNASLAFTHTILLRFSEPTL